MATQKSASSGLVSMATTENRLLYGSQLTTAHGKSLLTHDANFNQGWSVGTENKLLLGSSWMATGGATLGNGKKYPTTTDHNLNRTRTSLLGTSLKQKVPLISSKNPALEPTEKGLSCGQPKRVLLENPWLKRKQDESELTLSSSEQKRLHVEKQPQLKMSVSSAHTLDENAVPKYKLETFPDCIHSLEDESFSLDLCDKKGDVYKRQQNLKLLFLSTVSTSLVNKPNFKNKKDLTRLSLLSQATEIAKFDPEFLLKVTLYTRQELNIRTTTNFLLALAANTEECKNYLKKYYNDSVRLPSDWIEIAEIYQTFSDKKVTTGSIPSMLRKEMVLKFPHFDEYQLAKYNKKKRKPKPKPGDKSKDCHDDIEENISPVVAAILEDSVIPCEPDEPDLEKAAFSLKRLIRLLHIKAPHEAVMALLGKKYPSTAEEFRTSGLSGIWDKNKAGARMKLPVPVTWETQVSEKGNVAGVWEDLLDRKKLPYMAMLRNLSNLLRANVSAEHNRTVMNLLSNKAMVEKSRQFPSAFYSAYKSVVTLEEMLGKSDHRISELTKQKIRLSALAVRGSADACRKLSYLKSLKKRMKTLNFYTIGNYKEALEKAIEIAVEKNVNPVPGRTLVLCDLHSFEAEKPKEESMLLGVMCMHACEECELKVPQTGGWKDAHIQDNSILKNVKDILWSCSGSLSEYQEHPSSFYGEYLQCLLENYLDLNVTAEKQLDNIIFLTNGEVFSKSRGPRTLSSFLSKYRNIVNPCLLYVHVDVTGKSRCLPPDCALDVHLSGSSDQLLRKSFPLLHRVTVGTHTQKYRDKFGEDLAIKYRANSEY